MLVHCCYHNSHHAATSAFDWRCAITSRWVGSAKDVHKAHLEFR
jgi:hypothetical protein